MKVRWFALAAGVWLASCAAGLAQQFDTVRTLAGPTVAGEIAFKAAKLTPKDIDVAQTHDCFTISEIIEVEELGFCKKGEGGAFVASGQIKVDGQTPTNTDGGLLTVGHPYGATGARQAVEICKQLQGRALNQVKNAKFGLTHNLSGVCAQHTVVVYGTEPVK